MIPPTMMAAPPPMMAEGMFATDLLTILCEKGGQMRLNDLYKVMNQSNMGIDLSDFLHRYPGLFRIDTSPREPWVMAHTQITFCEKHYTKMGCSGQMCSGLHICKYYILSECRYGTRCSYGHDNQTSHNRRILADHMLDSPAFTLTHMKVLIARNRNSQLLWPQTCKFYNNEGGCRAKDGTKCSCLHVCRYFVLGNCGYDPCKRSHDVLSPQCVSVLSKYGIDIRRSPREVVAELRQAIANEDTDKEPSDTSSFFGDRGSSYAGSDDDDECSVTSETSGAGRGRRRRRGRNDTRWKRRKRRKRRRASPER
jgi:hypothetical protein